MAQGDRAGVEDDVGGGQREMLLTTGALQSAIFNSANFSSIATDARGVIQIFNVGAEKMLGYAAGEVLNQITPADISDPQELLARAAALSVEFGTSITPGFDALVFKASRRIEDIYELTYVRKDGTRFPAVVSVTALRDASDGIIGYLLIGTDNTARKKVEEERLKLAEALQQKNVELEDASRMKSEFLANMSHELRTPLNAIIGFSEVLRDGLVGPLSDKQCGLISDIFGSGNHLLSLINDILDLSKVEAGKMSLDLEAVSIASVVDNSLSIVRDKAAARNISLRVEGAGAIGEIHADPRKFKQIVYNLLSNAVKFTADGGQVALIVTRVDRAAVCATTGTWHTKCFPLAASDFQEFLEISIVDTGMGISEEELLRLFVPFSQIDGGLARRFEGTGLGLAMVKLLAELHGGTVAVQSHEAEGSRFTAWLPFRRTSSRSKSGSRLAVAVSKPPADLVRTALVIEDDLKSAALIRMQLEAEGFIVLHAASAEGALALAAQQPLSLITLDIMLPDMNGWDFLTRVKQLPALERTPVVIISIVADRNRGLSLGAAAVMQKPISRSDLHQSLVTLGLTSRPARDEVR